MSKVSRLMGTDWNISQVNTGLEVLVSKSSRLVFGVIYLQS